MNLKKIFSWASYDLANTAFTSPFQTIFWPLFVTSYLGGNEFQLGLTVGISLLFVTLIVPIFARISDITNRRMPYIIVSTLIAIIIMSLLPYTNLVWNLVLTGILIVAFNLGLTIYNSLLPTIAISKEMGRVSGFGMAAGFFGTILSLAATYAVLRIFAINGIETKSGVIATFPVMAAFFLVFSLPLFLTFRDSRVKKLTVQTSDIVKQIWHTLKNLRRYKGIIPFAITASLFANALAAVNIFFFLFAKKEIGVGLLGFMLLFSVQSIGAVTGALFFGWLTDKIGAKRTLMITGAMWIFVITIFLLSKTLIAFWIGGIIGSLAFSGVFSSARTLFVFLAPPKQLGEFFSYSQILGKFTGLFGPVTVGWLIVNYSYNAGLSMVWLILIAALLVLFKVPDVRRIIH